MKVAGEFCEDDSATFFIIDSSFASAKHRFWSPRGRWKVPSPRGGI